MAAICGVLQWGGPDDAGDVAAALVQRLAHRAPDGVHLHSEHGFGMAHGALHATPEAHLARQPMSLGGRWVIAVDGRIDNRHALARQLGVAADRDEVTPDAILFAQAWARWGVESWRHIIGDFALAAWDMAARELHLVRDRVGVRPLYYATTPRLLAFASEQDALLGVPGVSAAFDEDRIAYYLAPAFTDDDLGATWYRDVRRVQPGERLHVDATGTVKVVRYWRMQPLEPATFDDPGDAVEAFREVFDEAVSCRLRGATPAGLMLSGGIDSAAIQASAMRLSQRGVAPRPVPISVVHDSAYPEETANIEAMLRHSDASIRLAFPAFSQSPAFEQFARDTWAGADGWSAALLPRLVFRAARDAGLRVVLDGVDGDLAMSPPSGHVARRLLSGRPREAWRLAKASAAHHTYLQGLHPATLLALDTARHLQPGWLRSTRTWLASFQGVERMFGPMIDPAFARRLGLPARRHALARAADRRAREGWQQGLIHRWWSPGLTRGMEGFDAMAAREGIEPRHPWADLRVLEFFLRLPVELGVRDGWTKYVARAASAPMVGDAVAWHAGKDHFGYLVSDALFRTIPGEVMAALSRRDPWLEARVSTDHLSGLRQLQSGGLSASDAFAVLEVAALAAWQQRVNVLSTRSPDGAFDPAA